MHCDCRAFSDRLLLYAGISSLKLIFHVTDGEDADVPLIDALPDRRALLLNGIETLQQVLCKLLADLHPSSP